MLGEIVTSLSVVSVGTWSYAKVDITLSKPVKDKTVLSRIDVQTQDPKELLPLLETSGEGWDLEANSLSE